MNDRVDLRLGDCLEVMKSIQDCSVDSCVCDPPYHLTSIVKRFGGANAAPAQFGADGAFARVSRGFRGQTWDGGDIAFRVETWAEVFRVLKPGGHLLAFSGTRTYHRMVCAIEDAGFEIRDRIRFECSPNTKYGPLWDSLNDEQRGALLELLNDQIGIGSELAWEYGSGFPKSLNVAKAIESGGGRPEDIRRMAMGEGYEPSGRGRLNYDHGAASAMNGTADGWSPASDDGRQWSGWGTALKPSHEPICVARKPLAGTVAANVLRFGSGALNLDACRVPVDGEGGRFPANVIHDGSDEVLTAFAAYGERGASAPVKGTESSRASIGRVTGERDRVPGAFHGDAGTAARFFYAAKASPTDRSEGLDGDNAHPTVKPTSLMAYLCRLVTPPGGVVLDPFMGSGSTGKAAMLEGFQFIGIEREPNYFAIAEARIAHAIQQAEENERARAKAERERLDADRQLDMFMERAQ